MGFGERIRPNTPFGPLKRSGQPLCLLQDAKKSLNCIEKGEPKEILMEQAAKQRGDIVDQRGKDKRLF